MRYVIRPCRPEHILATTEDGEPKINRYTMEYFRYNRGITCKYISHSGLVCAEAPTHKGWCAFHACRCLLKQP